MLSSSLPAVDSGYGSAEAAKLIISIQNQIAKLRDVYELARNRRYELKQKRVAPFDALNIAVELCLKGLLAFQEVLSSLLGVELKFKDGTNAATLKDLKTEHSRVVELIANHLQKVQERTFAELESVMRDWLGSSPPAVQASVHDIIAASRILQFVHPTGAIYASQQDFQKLLSAHGDAVWRAIAHLIAQRRISFPYKRFTYGHLAESMFNYLKNYQPDMDRSPFTLPNQRFSSSLFPFTFDGGYVCFRARDEDYEAADMLVDLFQEEQRMRAKRQDQRQSPIEYWMSLQNQQKIFEHALRNVHEISPRALREAVYVLVKECTQFKPTLVVSLLRFLKANRVLDFSAGWGDRLVGAIAAGVQRYLGVDPNIDLRAGHDQIIQCFAAAGLCPLSPGGYQQQQQQKHQHQHQQQAPARPRFEIIYAPFEEAQLPPGETFDLVFTSPPFFDFEIYSKQPGQSVARYPKLEEWLVNFLFASVRKSWERLEPGGHLAVHIADVYKTKVCEPMNLYCLRSLPGAHYRGVLAASGKAAKPRPIWIWQKRSEPTSQELQQQADSALRSLFPAVYECLLRTERSEVTATVTLVAAAPTERKELARLAQENLPEEADLHHKRLHMDE